MIEQARAMTTMEIGGTYDCVTRTPMGEQRGTFTVTPSADGTEFSGVLSNDMGTLEVENGVIDGHMLRWTMNMRKPMPMTLECEAEVEGDAIKGSARAGVFGRMPISGHRIAD